MKFGIINAEKKTATLQEFDDLWPAGETVGLKAGAVDFGSISRELHLIVYEHGMYVPMNEQHYFAIDRQLFAGNAVLFACGDAGETVSLERLPPILWFKDAAAIELAIQRGDIIRPIIAVGDSLIWEWKEKGFQDAK